MTLNSFQFVSVFYCGKSAIIKERDVLYFTAWDVSPIHQDRKLRGMFNSFKERVWPLFICFFSLILFFEVGSVWPRLASNSLCFRRWAWASAPAAFTSRAPGWQLAPPHLGLSIAGEEARALCVLTSTLTTTLQFQASVLVFGNKPKIILFFHVWWQPIYEHLH